MITARKLIGIANRIQKTARTLGLVEPSQGVLLTQTSDDFNRTYLTAVTDPDLRMATERLFFDGHYARAIEEAYKCVNNYVKQRCGLTEDGANLMQRAFSANDPYLRLNKLKTRSQQDEQLGYMQIFAGSMIGVRNPRAHEHHIRDDPKTALELLTLANHLIGKVKRASRSRKRTKKP